MHESDSPPAPPRFRRSARCELVMAHNDGVGDVSTIQTTPPFEINLAAGVQKVQKMIADHIALTTLASHGFFLLIDVPTIPGESGSIRLLLQPCPSRIFWMNSDRVVGGAALCCTASSSALWIDYLKPLMALQTLSPNCGNLPAPKLIRTMTKMSSAPPNQMSRTRTPPAHPSRPLLSVKRS